MRQQQDKTSSLDLTQIAKLMRIREKVEQGVTVKRACSDVGYPRSSYYTDVKKLPQQESAA